MKVDDNAFIDGVKQRLSSDNPFTRANAIVDLDASGFDLPDLVEPLTSDDGPFMFGLPVLVVANAYMVRHGHGEYVGAYEDAVRQMVYELGHAESERA